MRFKEFNKSVDHRTDEVLPAIGAAMQAVGGAAKTIGGAAAKAVGNVAKKAVGTAVGAVAGAAKSTIGTDAAKAAQKSGDALSAQLLKRGSKIPMPTQSGPAKEFEVDDVKGDEVTLINPDAKRAPEEPEKITYKKQDVDTIIKGLTQQ